MDNKEKLENAMAEIRSIIQKNDIAGVVALHAPGIFQFEHHVDTTYSCMRFGGQIYEFLLDKKWYGNDLKKRDQQALGTSDMIHAFADYLQGSALLMADACKVLDEAAGIVRDKPAIGEQVDG